jgi:hypothetical protein
MRASPITIEHPEPVYSLWETARDEPMVLDATGEENELEAYAT